MGNKAFLISTELFSEFSFLWLFVTEVRENVNVVCLLENTILVGTTCNYVFHC